MAARWSKVRDRGRMRRMVAAPSYGTTFSRIRPAPTIATWGGLTMGLAYWPVVVPKLDRVMVAPCISFGGILRVATASRRFSSPLRRSFRLRWEMSLSTGTNRPSGVSTAMPTCTSLSNWRLRLSPSNQQFSSGTASQAFPMAWTRRMVVSVPFFQSPISTSSKMETGTTWA